MQPRRRQSLPLLPTIIVIALVSVIILFGSYLVSSVTPNVENWLEQTLSTIFPVFVLFFSVLFGLVSTLIRDAFLVIFLIVAFANLALMLPLTLWQNSIGARGHMRGQSSTVEDLGLLALIILKYVLIACMAVAIQLALNAPTGIVSRTWLGLDITATPASTAPIGLIFPFLVALVRYLRARQDGRVGKKYEQRGYEKRYKRAEAQGAERLSRFLEQEAINRPFREFGNVGGQIAIAIGIFIVTAGFSTVYSLVFLFNFVFDMLTTVIAERVLPGKNTLRKQAG